VKDLVKRKIIGILIFALFIRLLSLFLFKNINNYDLESYQLVGNLTRNFINIYPSPANIRYPYLPFYLYLEAIGSVIFLKTLNIAFDLGILYLVYLISKRNLKTAFLYAVNPVTISISTLHGQFDVIPLFFFILSFYLLTKKKETAAVLSFSLSVLTKTWPLMFIFILLKSLKNKRLIFLTFVFPAVGILAYSYFFKATPFSIIKTVAGYQGLSGIWGFGYLFRSKIFIFVFLVILFIYSYFLKGKNLIKKSYRFLVVFFFTTLGFSVQYLGWFVPFLILEKRSKSIWLLVSMSAYIISLYSFWVFFPNSVIVPWWLISMQNILGTALWLDFGIYWYISTKSSCRNSINL